jgi:DNA polymerase-3 subunit alpha (Gram-positive type)
MFPKAHAVSCTLVAWKIAYYMTYYPEEYKEALVAAR